MSQKCKKKIPHGLEGYTAQVFGQISDIEKCEDKQFFTKLTVFEPVTKQVIGLL